MSHSRIKGFFKISCAKDKGIKKFKKNLIKEIGKVKHITTEWPESWFEVKSKLEEMNINYIPISKYRKICKNLNVKTTEAQRTLVDFLHDLGVILHFKDMELLDTQVLEPRWVTQGVYKMITSKKVAGENGIMKFDWMDEILEKKTEKDFEYPREKYKFLINLMKKFELCWEYEGNAILIPDLLTVGKPKFSFDYKESLKFIIQYNFLPKSIIARFIVQTHRDIKDKFRWRTGVVLHAKKFQTTAVIRADEEDETIYINVTGKQKSDYLAIITYIFQKITQDYKKMNAIEEIALPDDPQTTVGYKYLLKLERMEQKIFIPEGATEGEDKFYEVQDLLGRIRPSKDNEALIITMLLNILEKIEELQEVVMDEKTAGEKINDVIKLKFPFLIGEIDINKLISIFLKNRKKIKTSPLGRKMKRIKRVAKSTKS